jgi:two-component system, chemotaxis family, chemotaxis protein CheY
MRILIVEDEKVSRQKMQVIMNNFGECDCVARGDEAISAFQKAWEMKAPYDVITLDIVLDDMNGMDVLIDIRKAEEEMKLPQTKKTKIIMVTAHGNKDFVTTCKTAECDGYIVKPFTRETITICLKEIYLNYVDSVFTI